MANKSPSKPRSKQSKAILPPQQWFPNAMPAGGNIPEGVNEVYIPSDRELLAGLKQAARANSLYSKEHEAAIVALINSRAKEQRGDK
jgi:hypothetical protein